MAAAAMRELQEPEGDTQKKGGDRGSQGRDDREEGESAHGAELALFFSFFFW